MLLACELILKYDFVWAVQLLVFFSFCFYMNVVYNWYSSTHAYMYAYHIIFTKLSYIGLARIGVENVQLP